MRSAIEKITALFICLAFLQPSLAAEKKPNSANPPERTFKCPYVALLILAGIGGSVAYYQATKTEPAKPVAATQPQKPLPVRDKTYFESLLKSELASRGLELPQELSITHLQQVHMDRRKRLGMSTTEDPADQVIVNSQLRIYETLKKGSASSLVFLEGLKVPLTPEVRAKCATFYDEVKNAPDFGARVDAFTSHDTGLTAYFLIRRNLPNGAPNKPISDCTPSEKMALYMGGPYVLWTFGGLDSIYPVEDAEFNRAAWAKWGTPEGTRLQDKREVRALGNIVDVNRNNPGRQIYLIYGLAHDFSKYSPQLRIEGKRMVTPEEMKVIYSSH